MKLQNLFSIKLGSWLVLTLVALCSSQIGLAFDYKAPEILEKARAADPEFFGELQRMFSDEGGVAAGEFSIGVGDTKEKRKLGRKAPAPGCIAKGVWRCSECGYEVRGTAVSGNMTKHMRTHTDEFPYACRVSGCDKRYRTDISLREHAAAKHTGIKLICGIKGCKTEAGYISNLQKHQRNKHPEDYAEGRGCGHKRARLTDGRD